MDRYIVIDFETTGLSPGSDRAIEVAAVLLEKGRIRDRFQSLMNPGKKVSPFIESYTGISNEMLSSAPPNDKVMRQLSSFIGKEKLVAHNAAFDARFLNFELKKAGKPSVDDMCCSLRVSRRLYQSAPNHRLETLVQLHKIKLSGQFHRALADAEMTARLWAKMLGDIEEKYKIRGGVTFEFIQKFGTTPKAKIAKLAQTWNA
jgi:DNA polymerase-3 subunit epsilon